MTAAGLASSDAMTLATVPSRAAIVTGASRGIGAAIAGTLARAGFDVLLVARSADALRERAMSLSRETGRRVLAHPADLRVPDAAPAVVTDAERLRRILENLVDNALKYTPEGGHVVVVVARSAAGGASVAVRDDGPGIAGPHLPRIFERFYRVDKARSRDVGGTGLGLAIVRHLADSIGARVEVASTLDVGTEFTVHLPRDARTRHAAAEGRAERS